MQKIICIFSFVALAALARAEDITLTDGTVYKNAEIVAHSVTSATIVTDKGGAIVPLGMLPRNLQVKLGYNPKAAADAVKKRAIESAAATASMILGSQYQAAAKKYVWMNGSVVPREVADVETLKVQPIGEADANDTDGNSLGHGCYCTGFVLWPGTDKWVPCGKMFILATKLPNGVPTILYAAKLLPKNADDQAPAAYTQDGGTVYAIRRTAVQTQNGEAVVYVPAPPITFDQWRKAGSPQ